MSISVSNDWIFKKHKKVIQLCGVVVARNDSVSTKKRQQ